MVVTVLQKMRGHPWEIILLAPRWPSQAWVPELLDLLVELAFQLPLLPSLLRQLDSNLVHLHLGVLNKVSLQNQPAS
jgi:hypothetical protein